MPGAVLGAGLSARVHVLGRACVPRARAVAAQRVARRAVQPLAMANPFEDKKKEAAKRALMAALEGKQDVLKENELKEAARLKAGGGGGGGRSGGGGGGGGDGGGKWRKETGTTLQTFLIIVGAVRTPLLQRTRRACPPLPQTPSMPLYAPRCTADVVAVPRSLCFSTHGASFLPCSSTSSSRCSGAWRCGSQAPRTRPPCPLTRFWPGSRLLGLARSRQWTPMRAR